MLKSIQRDCHKHEDNTFYNNVTPTLLATSNKIRFITRAITKEALYTGWCDNEFEELATVTTTPKTMVWAVGKLAV